ncbi:choice-of-anchor D domain-containing protein [Hyalangium versicolor]|uniref:choice-of-anchor D domain-containing protein n=1 Tax=Hyalangium versicolor TaxID=2861190 RepID=UPI001CD00F76|nr:choice-of-anchor D domain-containing protein [Hyalangium versicolor]
MYQVPKDLESFESMESAAVKEDTTSAKQVVVPCQTEKPRVTARILEAPRATLILRPSREGVSTLVLHSTAVSPAGGTFEWRITQGRIVDWDNIAGDKITLKALKPGGLDIHLVYTWSGQQASDSIHVVVQGHPQIDVVAPGDFGDVLVDAASPAQNIRLKNTGTAPLIVENLEMTGEHADCFSFVPKYPVIEPDQESTIAVHFAPKKSFGNRTAALTITSNAQNKAEWPVKLTGKATQPLIEVTSGSAPVEKLSFADLLWSEVKEGRFGKAEQLQIKNTGNAPLEVELAVQAPFSFVKETQPKLTIGAGSSKTVGLEFRPDTPGIKDGRLEISSNAHNTPKVAVALHGELIKLFEITPTLQPEKAVGWHDTESAPHCAAAVLKVGLQETPERSAYSGKGHVEVVEGNPKLYRDEACTIEAKSFEADELREGKPLYVKGGAARKGKVLLRLDPPTDPRITAKGPVQEPIEIKPVNVVTPLIELEYKAVLFDKQLANHQDGGETKVLTDLTRVELSLQETIKGQPFQKGAFFTASPGVEIYLDDKGKDLHDPLKALTYQELTGPEKKKLYLKGKTAGEVELTLTPEKAVGPGFRVTEKVTQKIIVVQLGLEPYTLAAAKPHAESVISDTDKVKLGRLLHAQDGGNFGRAKVVVKKPDDKLWSVGGADYKVMVKVHADSGGVELCQAAAGGGGAAEIALDQARFNAGDVTLWVQGSTAGKALRHARVDVGLDRGAGGLAKEIKRNGDWARFTVVKLTKVTPDTAGYKQKVNEPAAPLNPEKGPKYKASAHLSEKLQGIRLHFRLVAHEDNATTLPDVWKHVNPDTPITCLTDVNGVATGELELSGVHAQHKSGYNKNIFLAAAYVDGELIADDPKRNDPSPKYRVESNPIEIDAPALPCPCCGVNPGHSAGFPMSMDDWYRTVDFKTPPTAAAHAGTYNTLMADVGNRVARGCTCAGVTHVIPYNPCSRFFRPVTDAEYNTVISEWNAQRKAVQRRLRIPKESVVRNSLTRHLGYAPSQKEIQDERQVNHLVPKGAGACPANVGNLQAHGSLCAYCRGLDGRFGPLQLRISK